MEIGCRKTKMGCGLLRFFRRAFYYSLRNRQILQLFRICQDHCDIRRMDDIAPDLFS